MCRHRQIALFAQFSLLSQLDLTEGTGIIIPYYPLAVLRETTYMRHTRLLELESDLCD